MTTAHKPTFHPAIGQANAGGYRFMAPLQQLGARDMPGHTKLKFRVSSQNSAQDLAYKDFKGDLEEKERKHREKVAQEKKRQGLGDKGVGDKEKNVEKMAITHVPKEVQEFDDADASDIEDTENKAEYDVNSFYWLCSGNSDSEEDDSDDEAELLRELDRIKKEREAEKLAREAEAAEKETIARNDAILRGNPLVNLGGDTSTFLKRRWDDDIVFKNQARDEPESKKRFVNDTVRSDFHRKVFIFRRIYYFNASLCLDLLNNIKICSIIHNYLNEILVKYEAIVIFICFTYQLFDVFQTHFISEHSEILFY